MPHGKLTVIVERAIGIKVPSKHGRGDSYCTLQCGSQVLSTEVAEGAGSHPVFHTKFKFKIDRSTNDLTISVYSRGSVGDDELVGYTTLDFKTVFFHALAVPLTAYPLSRRSGGAGGHISISLKFKARPSPNAQNHHAPAHHRTAPSPHARPQPTARNQHFNYETSYEDGYCSSGSSESSRSSSKRSGDGTYSPYRRSCQSQPEQYPEAHGFPRTDPHEYQVGSHEHFVHHPPHPSAPAPAPAPTQPRYHHARPSAPAPAQPRYHHARSSAPAPAQPRYHHARTSADQAIPHMPHRAIPNIPVRTGIPGPPQPGIHVASSQQPPPVRLPQAAVPRVPHQQQQEIHRQPPGKVVQVAGKVVQAVAVEVAKQGVQAVLGGLFGGD